MIKGIVGLMNSGKTLYMTKLLYQEYRRGKQVIANYDLNFPHTIVNKDFMIYLGTKQPVLKNVVFGFDELWIWLDARSFAKKVNKVSTYFFNQSSKDDTSIYFTAQHNDQIEKRIRQNLHSISSCSRVIYIDNKMKAISDDKRFLPNHLMNRLYIKIIDYKRVNIGNYTEMIPQKPKYIKADVIFNLYDTTQKIKTTEKIELEVDNE